MHVMCVWQLCCRAFGRLEQDIRKHDTVILAEEYVEISSNTDMSMCMATLGRQCRDSEAAAADRCKSQRSFKIGDAKIPQVNSDKVGFQQLYGGDHCDHAILKRGKKWEDVCVKPAKTDIR